MAVNITEEYITKLTLDTAQFLKNAQDTRATIDAIKIKLQELASTSKLSLKDLGANMVADIKNTNMGSLVQGMGVREAAQSQQALISAVKIATTELSKEERELQKLNNTAAQSKSAFGGVGDVIKMAFGVGLGQIATQAIRAFTNYMKEAVKSTYELAKATYMLQVGLNAMRRGGVDITLRDMNDNINRLRQTFSTFSKKELVEGSAQLINLTRDFGATKEQIFELQNAIATLALVNGRSMDDVQRTVALTLSSGYTEGLQRLGVSINRVTIALKAEEMGFGRNYMALTEQQRYLATLAIVLQKVAKYEDDVAGYSETAPGQIDKMKSAWKDFTAILVDGLLPVLGLVANTLSIVLKYFGTAHPIRVLSNLVGAAVEAFRFLFTSMAAILDPAVSLSDKLLIIENRFVTLTTKVLDFAFSIGEAFSPEVIAKVKDFWAALGLYKPMETTAEIGDTGEAEANAEKINDIALEMWKENEKISKEYQDKQVEAEKNYQQDLADINIEAARKRKDIQDKYKVDKAKIIADELKEEKSLLNKYNLDVAQLERQYAIQRAEAEAKYREQQLKEEIDYQERLKKLREGFLMDLEDALRERDALQVIRAIRKYNLDKKQAAREHQINLDEMKRNHALEMEEMAKQKAERLRTLQEEYAQRLAMLRQETVERLAELARRRDAELEALKTDVTAKEDEATIKRNKALADALDWYNSKLAEMLANITETNKLTGEQLTQMVDAFLKAFGPNPAMDAAVKVEVARLDAIAAAYNRLWSAASGKSYGKATPSSTGKKSYSKNSDPFADNRSRAAGGIDYVTQPTWLLAGDAGDEMVITKPLTKAFSGNQYLNGNPISGLSSKGDRIDIALLLSPDLVAKVVRQSSDHVANVLMEVQRQ